MVSISNGVRVELSLAYSAYTLLIYAIAAAPSLVAAAGCMDKGLKKRVTYRRTLRLALFHKTIMILVLTLRIYYTNSEWDLSIIY